MHNRVAILQMTSGHEIKKNLATAKILITEAVEQGATWVVLPEMFAVMGLDQTDKVKLSETYGQGPIQDFLREQAMQHQLWIVGGTLPIASVESPEKVYAAMLVYNAQGEVVARYNKIHLFDAVFSATGESYFESKTTLPGNEVVVLETPFGKTGLAVCYDIRFPDLFAAMHEKNVEVIVIPSAFTYTTGVMHWEVLMRARAIENQAYVIAAAQTGIHDNGRKTYGHSMGVDPSGKIIASLPTGTGIVLCDIDLVFLRKLRDEFPVLKHRVPFFRNSR